MFPREKAATVHTDRCGRVPARGSAPRGVEVDCDLSSPAPSTASQLPRWVLGSRSRCRHRDPGSISLARGRRLQSHRGGRSGTGPRPRSGRGYSPWFPVPAGLLTRAVTCGTDAVTEAGCRPGPCFLCVSAGSGGEGQGRAPRFQPHPSHTKAPNLGPNPRLHP